MYPANLLSMLLPTAGPPNPLCFVSPLCSVYDGSAVCVIGVQCVLLCVLLYYWSTVCIIILLVYLCICHLVYCWSDSSPVSILALAITESCSVPPSWSQLQYLQPKSVTNVVDNTPNVIFTYVDTTVCCQLVC